MKIDKKRISNVMIILSQFLILEQFLTYFQTKYSVNNPLIPAQNIIIEIMDLAAAKGIVLSILLIAGLIFYFYKKYWVTIFFNGLILFVFLFYGFFVKL
jgi:hypothetical protein